VSAPTLHLKGYDFGPDLPLRQQARSLAAEIKACHVFQTAAHRDLAAGDIRALARLTVLDTHKKQLQDALLDLEIQIAEQRR
jgi:uncharacterized protein (UPF0335 family)